MKALLALLFVLITGTAFAADTGLYYNPDRDGEGLSLHRSGDTVVGFVFTYGGVDQEVDVNIAPWFSPQAPIEDPLNGQRWFMTSPASLVDDSYAEGVLYQTAGINYPAPLAPNGAGSTTVVGEYLLERSGSGWTLLITPSEDSQLEEDDPIFGEFDFSTVLLKTGD